MLQSRIYFPMALAIVMSTTLALAQSQNKIGQTATKPGKTSTVRHKDVRHHMKQTIIKARFHINRGKKLKSVMDLDTGAQAYLEMARLNGKPSLYSRAKRLLDLADTYTKPGSLPRLARIEYMMAMHAFRDGLKLIDVLLRKPGLLQTMRRGLLNQKGDAHFQLGQYEDALAAWTQADKMKSSMSSLARLAYYYRSTGNVPRATKLLDECMKLPIQRYGRRWAWLLIQRGLMEFDHGRTKAAIPYYKRAVRAFPGWYLSLEHLAEALADQGEYDKALKIYKRVLKSNKDPAFIDAVAGVYEAKKMDAKAKKWSLRAQKAYAERLAQYPQLTTGHALDYFLEKGKLETTLKLAQANFDQRPSGEATIKLIQARLGMGHLTDAHILIEKLLKTPYSTPEVHGVASLIFEAMKSPKRATEQKALALKLSTSAMADVTWLRSRMGLKTP